MAEQSTAVEARPSTDLAGPSGNDVNRVRSQLARMHDLMRHVMQKDVDYGVVPGTGGKPTLYKAGAEKLWALFHLAPSFKRDYQWDGEHLTVYSECTLTHQGTGVVVASGGAMCTSRETKYAYRQATRKCPECGKETIIRGKKEYGGGWLCFAKKGGCGAKWAEGAPEIERQSEGREPNPNIADCYNTIQKMADKRAGIAATLFGTAASAIYSQDVEDFADVGGQEWAAEDAEPEPTQALTPEQVEEVLTAMQSAAASDGGLDAYLRSDEFRGEWANADPEQQRRIKAEGQRLRERGAKPDETPPSPDAEPVQESQKQSDDAQVDFERLKLELAQMADASHSPTILQQHVEEVVGKVDRRKAEHKDLSDHLEKCIAAVNEGDDLGPNTEWLAAYLNQPLEGGTSAIPE